MRLSEWSPASELARIPLQHVTRLVRSSSPRQHSAPIVRRMPRTMASISRPISSSRLPGTTTLRNSDGKMCFLMVDSLRLIVLSFLPSLHRWLRYASTCSCVHFVWIWLSFTSGNRSSRNRMKL